MSSESLQNMNKCNIDKVTWIMIMHIDIAIHMTIKTVQVIYMSSNKQDKY